MTGASGGPSPDEHAPGGTFPLAGRSTARIGYGMGQVTRKAQGPDGQDQRSRCCAERSTSGSPTSTRPCSTAPQSRSPPRNDQQSYGTAVEEHLRTLGTDRIDVVNLRRSGFTPGLLAEGDQIVPLDDQLAELAPLREQGKVVAIGLSHITGKQLRAALPVGITCVQNIYNLLDRSHESLLDTCRDHGIAWVPYFLLGGGYGTLLAVTDAAAVQQTAARLGVTPSQVGLAWQLAHAHAPQTMLIPGTSSTAHLGR